jgi:hypothetical protein
VPILSLLLQIPFFIAAYQFLENLEALKGVSFWFIQDLSLADGLLGGVHFLPILMTLVNILTAFFYTRNGDKAELKQMLIVAVVFLVLLYNLPAALLLYWTMNNVFSFFRLFITNPEVFKYNSKKKYSPLLLSIKNDKKRILIHSLYVFLPLSIFAVISQWNWANHYTFDGFEIRVILAIIISFFLPLLLILFAKVLRFYKGNLLNPKVSPKTFFSLLFISTYFYFASLFYYTGVNLQMADVSLIVLLFIQYVGFIYFFNARKSSNTILVKLSYFVLIVLSLLQLINLIFSLIGEKLDIVILNVQLFGDYPILTSIKFGIISALVLSYFYLRQFEIKRLKPKFTYGIFLLSILYILGSILFWNPLITFSSFPDAFEYSAIDILNKNLPYFFVLLTGFTIVFAIVPKSFKTIVLIISVVISIISFVNTTIIPIDLGTLQINKYSEAVNLAAPFIKYIVELALFLLAIFLTVFAFSNKHSDKVLLGLFLLNAVLIYQSMEKSLGTNRFFHKKDFLSGMEHIMNFSKTEKNVVFIIPDMFQGWSMHRILEETPEIKDELNGFTWYSNTLSISRSTNTSMPAIFGGYDSTPDKLDMDKEHTIKQKMTSVVQSFVDKAHSNGAIVTSNKLPYTNMDDVDFDIVIPYWTKKWEVFNNKLKIGKNVDDGYTILIENALLYSLPLIIKPEVYNKGTWFDKYKKKSKINLNNWIAKRYNFIRVLPEISSANSKKPHFNIIYSFTTHYPWNTIDNNGVIHKDTKAYQTDKWFVITIAKWFEWMKENDVYDNTKIIIVSDHGVPWERFMDEIDFEVPFKNINDDVVSVGYMLGLNPLLLVKDYNQNEPLKIDTRFMSNIDVNSIVFDKSNPTNTPIDKNRVLQGFISWWAKDLDNKTQFSIDRSYMVKDNIFDGNNWKRVD